MSVYILSQGSIFCVLSRFHFRRVLPFSSLVWNRRDMTLFMGFLWQVTMKFSSSFYFFKLSGNKCEVYFYTLKITKHTYDDAL